MSYCIQVSRQRKPRAYSNVWKNWKKPAHEVRWQTGTSTPPAVSVASAAAAMMANERLVRSGIDGLLMQSVIQ